MFSANENIVLRQHKRRVTEFIESTIPENALELGTSVMVMQVSCRQPGCVPLETAITIIFPKPVGKKKKKRPTAGSSSSGAPTEEKEDAEVPSFPQPLIPNLEESRIGGSFKTRILKPLAEVTLDDVLEALPPNFKGGKKTVESICLKARDIMFAQIGQLVGVDDTSDNKDSRRLVAQYLKACLKDYEQRDYVAPEWGEEFPPLDDLSEKKKDEEDGVNNTNGSKTTTMDSKWGKGNIVFRRPDESEDNRATAPISDTSTNVTLIPMMRQPSINVRNNNATSSAELLQQIAKSDHAPGIRRAGCPCCEPDSASNYADKMMGL